MAFVYCRGCSVEWPAGAIVDGLCPVCRPPSPQRGAGSGTEPAPNPDPVRAADAFDAVLDPDRHPSALTAPDTADVGADLQVGPRAATEGRPYEPPPLRTYEPVARLEPERRVPRAPLSPRARELDERCARFRLLGLRGEGKRKPRDRSHRPPSPIGWSCVKCDRGAARHFAYDLCSGCYARWRTVGKPFNDDGTPDLTAFKASKPRRKKQEVSP